MFESMIRQEMAFHDQDENKSSALATRLATNVPFCKGLTSDSLNLLCQAVSSVGFSIILGLALSWKLTLVIMPFIPFSFLTGIANVNQARDKSNEEQLAGRLAIELIENVKTLVVSLGRELYFYDQFSGIFNKKFRVTLLKIHPQGILYGISNSILFFIQATAFAFGYTLIKSGEQLTTANLFCVYSSITYSAISLGRLFALMPDIGKAREAAEFAQSILERRSLIDSMSEEGLRPDIVRGEIEFRDVRFRYLNRPAVAVLNGFNLRVSMGKVNALVGASGCGKSTTIGLIFTRNYKKIFRFSIFQKLKNSFIYQLCCNDFTTWIVAA
jgi:ATP-binding cassette subfamily B (MDR/TAP) protein 1